MAARDCSNTPRPSTSASRPADSDAVAMSNLGETDYLVIGGGSGGCAAARILAERSGGRVLVLESGGTNEREGVSQPDRWAELLGGDTNWAFETTPQGSAAGRIHRWPMGRILGGSSSVNGMKYMRGGPWDYDRWVELGCAGWDAEQVYRVYRDLEDYPEGDQRFHGTGGPISLLKIIGDHPLTAAFLAACDSRGYRYAEDFNSFDAEGYGTNQLNIHDGRREDAASALLGPYMSRDNLDVVLDATAEELVLDRSGHRVESVRYRSAGTLREIAVACEVVVAAGAIASPHLLMLSGIGPEEQLKSASVRVTLVLPGVGKNLHDHIGVPMVYESRRPFPSSRYQSTEATLYLRGTPASEHFDMQVTINQFAAYLPAEYVCGPDAFTFFPGTLKPRSRGTISLRSSDPDIAPVIDPGYLTHVDDVDMLAGVVGVVRELAAAPSFDEWRGREVGPGPEVTGTHEIRDYVRQVASTYFHPAGSCRMGSDDEAVVDNRLKVRGVENLRVADASIMPELVSGNTNAPAMMIGWRAGEFIVEDARVHRVRSSRTRFAPEL
jgi:choline dehydrogenase